MSGTKLSFWVGEGAQHALCFARGH